MVDIKQLQAGFSGEIVTPGEATYDTARTTYATTSTPQAIVYPKTVDDVQAALLFAVNNELRLTVRSGGHSGLEFNINNDGMVIDMKSFSTITVVDQEKGIVSIGSGAHWKEAAIALRPYGLVISAGDSASVGVGGLTVGGGIGIMVRKYGLAIDQLVGAEIVTADGKLLQVNKDEHSDLFWAIRGGGGNFGIVTQFHFQAHHLKSVFFGTVTYELTDLRFLLTQWRDITRKSSVDVTTTLVVMPGFGGNPPSAQLLFCFANEDETAGEKALDPYLSIAPVKQQNVMLMPYEQALQEAHPPKGVIGVVKDGIFSEITEEVINQLVTTYTNTANKMMFLRSLGGKVREAPMDSTAFSHRDGEALLVCAAFLPSDTSKESIEKEMRFFDPIGKLCSGAYLNFFTLYNDEDLARMYPLATRHRLEDIKRRYDPNDLFSQNITI